MEANKKLDLAAVATIPVIMTLANSMLIPVLPLIEKKLGISSTQASLIITVYAAVAILFIPIAGYLSDRFGRKNVIIPSLSLAAIGGLISGLAAWLMAGQSAFYVILIGRFIQGIGAAGAFPIVLPLVGDMFRRVEDVSNGLGVIETSNTFGKVLSPIVGAALALVVWYLPFIVIPFICLISILSVAFLVKVPPKSTKDKVLSIKQFIQSIKNVFHQKGKWLMAIFIIGGIAMFVLFGFLFYLSTALEDRHHIHGIWKGLLLAIPLSAVCLASYITGKFVGENKSRMKWATVAGIALLTLSMLFCGFVELNNKWLLIALMFTSGCGIGIALPSLDALITEGIGKKQRGTITSLYSSMRFIGVAAGPLMTALLMTNVSLMFFVFAATSFVSGLFALFAIRTNEPKSSLILQ